MSKEHVSQPPPLVNVILICIVAFTSLATLASGGPSGQSSVNVNWKGQGRSVLITVAPVENRLDNFDYNGALYLDLDLDNVVEKSVDQLTWTLKMETESSEEFFKSGGFSFEDYNGQEDDRGLYGNAMARLGPLCTDKDDSREGCIPCMIEEGCAFTINVDLCYPDSSTRKSLSTRIAQEDGSKFYLSCSDMPDTEPCGLLSEWLEAEALPLTENLCSE